jgi:deferrochelatase/peroxidase EfeB
MNGMSRNPSAPEEPVLEMDEIQGLVVPGLLKPRQTLLGVRIPLGSREVALNFKKLLRELADEITTAKVALENRREYRVEQRQQNKRHAEAPGAVFVGIGLSYPGLRKMTPGAEDIPGEAFRCGLAARSALLGDPTDTKAEGNPSQWRVGEPDTELDALLVVAGDNRTEVDDRVADLSSRVQEAGLSLEYDEDGDKRDDLPGREHFGFFDDVSQPGVRGRASQEPSDFVTERWISSDEKPETWLYGRPGEDLVWPGEFILGYPTTSPDPLVPGPVTPTVPEWTRNGSFLAFRRLRQFVGLFWRTMRDEAARLTQLPGFEGMTDKRLAALLVGRWPSGAPVNRVPQEDDKGLGKEKRANNNLRFDSDTKKYRLVDGYSDDFSMANADPAGVTCPWAAHIRKLNTRDSSSEDGVVNVVPSLCSPEYSSRLSLDL